MCLDHTGRTLTKKFEIFTLKYSIFEMNKLILLSKPQSKNICIQMDFQRLMKKKFRRNFLIKIRFFVVLTVAPGEDAKVEDT